MKKLVLAYSGGLDTSYCLKTLSQEGYEVHAVSVNTGGFSAEEIKAQEEKANAMGARTYRSIDALQSFYDKIVSDKNITNKIPVNKLKKLFDFGYHTKKIDIIFKRSLKK